MATLILIDFCNNNDSELFEKNNTTFSLLQSTFKTKAETVLYIWKQLDMCIRVKLRFYWYSKIPTMFKDIDYYYWKLVRIMRQSTVFMQIPERLRNNYQFAMKAVSNFGLFYRLLDPELKRNKSICLKSVKSYPKIYFELEEEFKLDREILLRALKSRLVLKKLPESFISDKEVLKVYLRYNDMKYIVKFIPDELLDDREIALSAIRFSYHNVKLISERLQHDFSFIIEAVKINIYSFLKLPIIMQENRQLVIILSGINLPLYLTSEKFRGDAEIVKNCVEKRFYDCIQTI